MDVAGEEEMETAVALDLSAPTSEREAAMAMVSSVPPTPLPTYSTVVTSSRPFIT